MATNLEQRSSPTPSDILITSELAGRPERSRRPQVEAEGFHELAILLASDPSAAIQRFLEIALEQCGAGSSGLSMLRNDSSGNLLFYWDALAGAYASFVGGTTPRDFSPCGLCLDAGGPILVCRPARLFTYFEAAQPPIIEGLVVPLYDNSGVALGTLWVVYHDDSSRCAPNDVRVLQHWAAMLVLALKLLKDKEIQAQAATAAEDKLSAAVRVQDAMNVEVHHRVKNSLQSTISLLALQQRTPLTDAREALREAQARLRLFAEVHELLYRNSSGAYGVPMGSLLRSLAASVATSFQAEHVRLDVQVEDVDLPAEQAIPAGLLMNEALTNAYKHAFPGNGAGHITVQLRGAGVDALILEVRDDGVGVLAADGSGLGLALIKAFAKQLAGNLDMSSPASGGHAIVISMPRTRRQEPA